MPETKDITVNVNLNDTDFWLKLGRLISAFQKQAEELAARFSEQAVALQGMADSLKEMEANMPDTIHAANREAEGTDAIVKIDTGSDGV